MNSAAKADDRYEDFLTRDLISDAEASLPQAIGRPSRFVAGNSMGGFAAIVLALKHPDLYAFAGALSAPVDFPRRTFTLRRISQSLGIRRIFGPEGSATRTSNDPFVLAREAKQDSTPFLFVSVGDQESLRDPVERFNAVLTARRIPHVFLLGRGGHNWQQWNDDLPMLLKSLESTMSAARN
jgi:S-formylglutathione hydrolase FrmB